MARRNKYLMLAVATVTLAAIAGGGWLLLRPETASEMSAKPTMEVVTRTTDSPSESKSAAQSYGWKGAAADPKKIIMPSIGVDAFIQNMGVDQHKEVAAPSNIHLAGWFVDSVRPGQRGLSIIDGHVNGRTEKDAVFAGLAKLKPGDFFTVIRGDDAELRYKVMNSKTVVLAKVPDILYSQDPSIRSQLNLITCGGAFDRASQEYASRTVVTAALQQ